MKTRVQCPRCRHPEAEQSVAPDGRPKYTCTKCGWWWTDGVKGQTK
jgi:transposase-like protein